MNVGINGVSSWGGRWMSSQQGRAEVQLTLASGQSFWCSVSLHALPQEPRAGARPLTWTSCHHPLPLFMSKLTHCHVNTFFTSLTTCPKKKKKNPLSDLRGLWYQGVDQRQELNLCCQARRVSVKNGPLCTSYGVMVQCSKNVGRMLGVVRL